MKSILAAVFAVIACTSALAQPAAAAERLSFTTNWYAQAEHGGFYQALATGLYRKAGRASCRGIEHASDVLGA